VLTLEQAAELLQVDAAEVAALADAGELPGRRLDGGWRFPRAALLEWLAAR
jgi:excisionase family DNA binding protein